jgi:hypothetical protein
MGDCAEGVSSRDAEVLLPPCVLALRIAIQGIVRSNNDAVNKEVDVEVITQATTLIKSLKGVRDARVHADAGGAITRIDLVCVPGEERAAGRNVHSAMMAVFGIILPPGTLNFPTSLKQDAPVAQLVTYAPPQVEKLPPREMEEKHPQVLEITGPARRADLNVAARTAFDTLRAAQASFHGFIFDGAELVMISEAQYIVVAVKRTTTDARYCGAAPVIDSMSTASARALMNAVGVAAMATPVFELEEQMPFEMLKA